MTDTRQAKADLRTAIANRLAEFPQAKKEAESRSLTRRILELLPKPPHNVCGFVPLKDEVLIQPLLNELLGRGYRLFLPRFENGALAFREAPSLSQLKPGHLQIPEPTADANPLPSDEPTTVLVPGRAFDAQGGRLGRGNGGYDVWIRTQRSQNRERTFWGVCYELQQVLQVPVEEHDERVDRVLTARG